MKENSYNRYVNEEVHAEARERAATFVAEETQFQLGHLPTEQPHPYTTTFSSTLQNDAAEGVRQLLAVDEELPAIARNAVLRGSFDLLVEAFALAARGRNRVCFSGCGSTGRLSVILEEMWRAFWEARAGVNPGDAERDTASTREELQIARLGCSIMTGGDRALVRSVENFEDYERFGARQVADLGLGAGDVLVAISEGGETSSVIGTAREALRRDCRLFFVFNNPTRILCEVVERSRTLIDDTRAVTMDLFSGPMALSGSTRMQATTLEMVVVGIAMEEALLRVVGDMDDQPQLAWRLSAVDSFGALLASFHRPDNIHAVAALATREANLYRRGGRVTYFADRYLLDIFSDTTERTPTFMLPPFRPVDDVAAPESWAFAKHVTRSSDDAWFTMLRRAPRGIEWGAADYEAMGAPETLIESPPQLDRDEIARYRIGNEVDVSRSAATQHLSICFVPGNTDSWEDVSSIVPGGDVQIVRMVSDASEVAASGGDVTLLLHLPASAVELWHHIAVKLLFNTVSTATMGILGRIQGNWMVQVDPTNKKLVDRGSRIIAQLSGLSYERACAELYASMGARRLAQADGVTTTTSPVVAALERTKRETSTPLQQ